MSSNESAPEDLVDQILRDHETNARSQKRSQKWSHMTLPLRKRFKKLCEISYQLTRGEQDPSDLEVDVTINELMMRIEKRLEVILIPASCREKMLDGDLLTEENEKLRSKILTEIREVAIMDMNIKKEEYELAKAEEELKQLRQKVKVAEEQRQEAELVKSKYPKLNLDAASDSYTLNCIKYKSTMFSLPIKYHNSST